MSHARVQTTKTLTKHPMTTDLTKNYDADMSTSDVKEVNNFRKQIFEDEADNKILDKEDTQRSTLRIER